MRNVFNTSDEFDKCFNNDLLNFCKNHCVDCSDSGEFKEIISDIKIKNNRRGCKIAKLTLQTYAFVYQRLMDFAEGTFDYEKLATINFFESVHKLIIIKIHLHYSDVTGRIYKNPNFLALYTFFWVLTCFSNQRN